jgi:methyl-accepting chemotaxis protein
MVTWYKNQKISKKLIIGFLIVALLAAVVGVVGVINILNINNADTALYKENALGLQYSGEAAKSFQRLRYNMVMLTLQETADKKEAYKSKITDCIADIDTTGANYQYTITNAEDEELYNHVVSAWIQYKADVEELVKLSAYETQPEMLALIASNQTLADDIRDSFDQLMELNATHAKEKSVSNDAAAHTALIVEIVIIMIVVIIAIILGAYIAGLIGKPIARAAQLADMLSVGNIDFKAILTDADMANLQRKDEVGQLSVSFNKLINTTKEQVEATQRLATGDLTMDMTIRSENDMLGKSLQSLVDSLNDVASSIVSASNQVASGANMISNSSMTLSQGATEQASSVEELTASVEEIAAQTAHNAQNAVKANELAETAKKHAISGDNQMNEMLKAMDAINVSSGNINKIIKVIDDIAFQTNILALNAAVEAARAGQHGKGFAVVAEEVRTLAAKSANAVKETTDMIEGSIRNVETGIRIANDTAGALKKIVAEVSNAAELVGAIADASNEQAQGIEQLNQGIMQVSQVVQSNAATSEESAAASEELASQADQLREVVSIFKIKRSKMLGLSEQPAASYIGVENKPALKAIASGMQKTTISLESDFGKY